MKKQLPFLNAIAFAIMIVVNYLSMTGIINNNTNKSISDKYHNLFTPASYAFSIWGIIYLGLLAFVIYAIAIRNKEKENEMIGQIGWWFIISCLANALWIVCFLSDSIGLSVLVMIILLFSLVKIILNTQMELTDPPLKKVALLWWPFAIYSGWVSVALIADIAVWLTKIQWNGWGISEMNWTVIMIVIAGILNILITWKRNMREFTLSGCWALIAIGVANQPEHHSLALWAWIVAGVIVVSTMIHGSMNFRGFGKEV